MLNNFKIFFKNPFLTKETQKYFIILTGLILLIIIWRSLNFVSDWKFTHWVFNYQYEFVKRGLPGELLRLTGVQISYSLISSISLVIVFLLLCIMIYVFSIPLKKKPNHMGLWLFFWVALAHPATFQSFNFDIGRYDGLCLLLALLAILSIFKSPKFLVYLCVPIILTISLLVHEASFFMYVPFVLSFWIYREPELSLLPYKLLVFMYLIVITYIISTKGLVYSHTFEEHLYFLQNLYGDIIVGDSLSVLHREGIRENILYTIKGRVSFFRIFEHIKTMFLFLPLTFIFWKIIKFDIFAKTRKGNLKLFFLLSSFGPLLLYPLGHDHFRWWALTVTNFFLAFGILAIEDEKYTLHIAKTFFDYLWLALFILITGVLAGPLRITASFNLHLGLGIKSTVLNFLQRLL